MRSDTGMAHVAACPYCDHCTPGAESRAEADRRLATHIRTLHRIRIIAAREYQQLIAAGKDPADARAVINDRLRRALEGGSGHYARNAA